MVNSVSSALVRQLLRSGDLEKLEQLVVEGQGGRLVGEYSPDYKTRVFLKQVPATMAKIAQLHDAVTAGSLAEVKALLNDTTGADCARRKRLALCKDAAGVGLLHKAVYYDLPDVYAWLAETYPQTATVRDAAGRTPMHYVAMCRDLAGAQKLLAAAGADLHALDLHGHDYRHYVDHPDQLELPSVHKLRPRDDLQPAPTQTGNFHFSLKVRFGERGKSGRENQADTPPVLSARPPPPPHRRSPAPFARRRRENGTGDLDRWGTGRRSMGGNGK